jgi:hypothetical protein
VQFILAEQAFLFGQGVFNWTPKENIARPKSMLALIERALGASTGAP